ncbi:MAG TPA: hypothetical protein VJ476_05255 [Rhizomicrobium sp.]|nr:hypothetical protein [Rhizomicrobium sp.]
MTAAYNYLTCTLGRGRKAWADFAGHVRSSLVSEVATAGGEVVGLFQGQLGFASNEAVVLLRRPERSRHAPMLVAGPKAIAVQMEALTPTVRPADTKKLKSGGIYVHRWFTVDAEKVADFIDLSNRAWQNFEGSYDTEIFGLFTAEAGEQDVRNEERRLLLLTWYASHGVWETSRDQTRDPAGLFVKRHELTRSTIGRSSLAVPLT